MPFPQWYAGQIITAERLNARNMQIVEQESNQTITNDESWNPTELSLELEPNSVYAYWCYIAYSAGSGDFAWSWNATGVTPASFSLAHDTSASGGHNGSGGVILRRASTGTSRIAGGSGSEVFKSAYDRGTFTTSSGTPSITLMFRQYSESNQDTIFRGGNQSRLLYQRIA